MSSPVEYKRLSSTSSEKGSHPFDEITSRTADSKGSPRKHSHQWTNIELSWSGQTITVFVIWYVFSFLTLFFNKYILMDERNDPVVLGESLSIECPKLNQLFHISGSFQLLMCSIGGYFHVKVPIGMISTTPHAQDTSPKRLFRKERFSKILIIVGCLRFSTLLFGLIALWFAPVSFAETVKSAAPVFTVLLARIVLGEKCSGLVLLALIPVVLGLVICSTYELSFNSSALIAALAANISECLQNVFSKKLLVSDRLDPHHLQLLTSISSLIIQVPCLLFLVDFPVLWQTVSSDSNLLLSYILNGVCFHCQSLSEYMLLYQISPVTHSVANTTKRALLILLSVMTFGNVVTPQSWLGTFIVFFGVYIYNKARSVKQHHEQITNTV